MKKFTRVLISILLIALGGASVFAQVGRRTSTGRSERVAVPLELPEPPSGLRQVDVEEGATVSCACLAQQPDAEKPCGGEESPSEQVFRGTEVDVKAVVVYAPEPGYTREARWYETQGRVILEVVFASSGKVSSIKVLEGLPHGLTNAGIAAACQIEFKPAQKNGQAVSQFIKVEYNFNLDARPVGPGRPPILSPRGVPTMRRMPPVMMPPQPFEWQYDDEAPAVVSRFGYGVPFPWAILPSPPTPFGGLWSCGWPSLF